MKSSISAKGQVTIPIRIRKELGLQPGTLVEFHLRKGEAILRKRTSPDLLHKWSGYLKVNATTDQLLDEMRGPRPRFPSKEWK